MKTIWNEEIPKRPALKGTKTCDVLIVGGGLTGILCAYFLSQAGFDCVVLEADRIGRGVSAATSAKITALQDMVYTDIASLHGTEQAALYYKLCSDAIHRYEKLSQTIDFDFEKRSAALFSRGDTAQLTSEWAMLRRLGAPVERITPSLPFKISGAFALPDQACMNPLKLIKALSRPLSVFEQSAVRTITGHTANTDGGSVRAHKIVLATHYPIGRSLRYAAKLYQHRSYIVALENVDPVPQMLLEAGGGISLRSVGNVLLLGGCGHRTGKGCGLSRLKKEALRLYPQAHIRLAWGAQDCMSLDGMPYVGRYGMSEDCFAVTGYSKWGMTGAMMAAAALPDVLADRRTAAVQLFDPERKMCKKQLMKNLAEATGGLLTPRTPRCTHLGCALHYNSEEHSWDCACHGSRFDRAGRVLNTPANRSAQVPPEKR